MGSEGSAERGFEPGQVVEAPGGPRHPPLIQGRSMRIQCDVSGR